MKNRSELLAEVANMCCRCKRASYKRPCEATESRVGILKLQMKRSCILIYRMLSHVEEDQVLVEPSSRTNEGNRADLNNEIILRPFKIVVFCLSIRLTDWKSIWRTFLVFYTISLNWKVILLKAVLKWDILQALIQHNGTVNAFPEIME